MTEKRAFAALDGVRGVAALAVMLFHTGTWPVVGRMFPSAYLAVDLFFALSGFVVAHAYGERMMAGMGVKAFLRARFIRLWPLFALGMAFGLGAYVMRAVRFDELDLWALIKSFALQASFAFAAGLLLHALWREGRLPDFGRHARSVAWVAAGALLVLMMVQPGRELRPLFDLAVVLLAWPALMVAWIAARPEGRTKQACGVLGQLSYPAYVLHGPLFAVGLNVAAVAGMRLHPIPHLFWPGAIVAVLILSWLSARYFDVPVRRWLSARTTRSPAPGPAPATVSALSSAS